MDLAALDKSLFQPLSFIFTQENESLSHFSLLGSSLLYINMTAAAIHCIKQPQVPMKKNDVPQAHIFVDEVMFIQHYFPHHSLTLLWKLKQLYKLITLSKMKNASGLNIEHFGSQLQRQVHNSTKYLSQVPYHIFKLIRSYLSTAPPWSAGSWSHHTHIAFPTLSQSHCCGTHTGRTHTLRGRCRLQTEVLQSP